MANQSSSTQATAAVLPYLSLRQSVRPLIFAYAQLAREQDRSGHLATECTKLAELTEKLLEAAALTHLLAPSGPKGDAFAMVTLYPDTSRWGEPPNLPPLDEAIFPKAILNLVLRAMFGQAPAFTATRPGHGWLVNLVRLCDKAAVEYSAARDASIDYAANRSEGRVSPYFRAIDHLESCINALHRALLHAERIKGLREAPVINRTAWRALHDASQRLNDVRDAIEHTEERLAKGELPEGEPPILSLAREYLSMEGHSIRYEELARWILRLYQIMDGLLQGDSSSR